MQDGPWIWGPEDSIPGPRRALDTWLGSGVQWACEEDLCPGGLRAEHAGVSPKEAWEPGRRAHFPLGKPPAVCRGPGSVGPASWQPVCGVCCEACSQPRGVTGWACGRDGGESVTSRALRGRCMYCSGWRARPAQLPGNQRLRARGTLSSGQDGGRPRGSGLWPVSWCRRGFGGECRASHSGPCTMHGTYGHSLLVIAAKGRAGGGSAPEAGDPEGRCGGPAEAPRGRPEAEAPRGRPEARRTPRRSPVGSGWVKPALKTKRKKSRARNQHVPRNIRTVVAGEGNLCPT